MREELTQLLEQFIEDKGKEWRYFEPDDRFTQIVSFLEWLKEKKV